MRLGITLGDPAGIGPEIVAQVLNEARTRRSSTETQEPSWWNADLVVFGDSRVLESAVRLLGLPGLDLETATPSQGIAAQADALHEAKVEITSDRLVDFSAAIPGSFEQGKVSAAAGRASYEYFCTAIDWALRGEIDGIVTSPINKESLHLAGLEYPGHTEILEARTGAAEVGMMLTASAITCSLVTTHVPLAAVPGLLTRAKIEQVIRLTHEAMRILRDKPRPALTVLGLNPHAGEHGLFGTEEMEVIEPAVRSALEAGYNVRGPLPPDTAFLPAIRRQTDAYVCMYHDQGLIPLKALAFDEGVNVTLGLPIVRTSVDHGTAFDIAWKGLADSSSLKSALQLAWKLCSHRLNATEAPLR